MESCLSDARSDICAFVRVFSPIGASARQPCHGGCCSPASPDRRYLDRIRSLKHQLRLRYRATWRENGRNGEIKCTQIKKETTGKQRSIAAKHQGSVDHSHHRKKTFAAINDGFDQNTKTNRESLASSERKYQHIVYDVAAGACNVSVLRFREIDFSTSTALTSNHEQQRETQVEFRAEQ
jgi:hypothetical protein